MQVSKHIHHGYRETNGEKSYFGKRHYIFESEKGEISMVELIYVDTPIREIYCLQGGLFQDVEQYRTKEEAEARVKDLLAN